MATNNSTLSFQIADPTWANIDAERVVSQLLEDAGFAARDGVWRYQGPQPIDLEGARSRANDRYYQLCDMRARRKRA